MPFIPTSSASRSAPLAAAVLAAGLTLFTVPPALAQGAAGGAPSAAASSVPAARDPLDPRAAVPPLRHRSAFAGPAAVRSSAPDAIDWREANDTTARVGGWRAYAREAQAPDVPAAAVSAPAAAPSGHRTGHHHQH